MASLEKRGKWYRVIYRFGRKRYTQTLNTEDRKHAEVLLGGIEKTLMLMEQKVLRPPMGCDIRAFVINGGTVDEPVAATASNGHVAKETAQANTTLGELHQKYLETHSIGAMESNSLATASLHLKHFEKSFGRNFLLQSLTLSDLQCHVNRRAKMKGARDHLLSPNTIRKEISSLRAAWNWGVQMGFLEGVFPNRGLKYPKTQEKPPFQTWAEIQRQIARGGLAKNDERALWDCLYLTKNEISEILEFIRENSRQPFLFPMSCFAAHTGARRSEMLRAQVNDVDLEGKTVLLHERKRQRGTHTSRRVRLSAFLAQVLHEWLLSHPGGHFLFCQQIRVFRSKKKRTAVEPVTPNEARDHLKRTLAGCKWKNIRGWHVFRHSFVSNCASQGIDQRMIDEWTGHQTDEMRKRYRHLFPSVQQAAIDSVFGGE